MNRTFSMHRFLIFPENLNSQYSFFPSENISREKKKTFPTDIGRQNISLNVNKEDLEQLPLHLPVRCNRKSQKSSHLPSCSSNLELAGADSLSGSAGSTEEWKACVL